MKNIRSILIIVIILLVISVLLIIKRTSSTLNSKQSDFAVEDTASITKIFLSDKKNNNILLTRQSVGSWKLNNKYDAGIDRVNTLLKTVNNLSVRAPVSKAAHNNIISRMSAIAVKVEIYQKVYRINFPKIFGIRWFPHEKLTKTFYVGDNTPDNNGTFMLMQGCSKPYIMMIPSFRGFLSTRFIPDEDVWRNQNIFSFNLKDIKSVRIDFPATPDSSFTVSQNAGFSYSLTRLSDNKIIPYDTLKLLAFLSAFRDIRYEALINKLDKHIKDSIISSQPWHIISLTNQEGKTFKIKTFRKKPQYGQYYDDFVKQLVMFDRDRLYALINNDSDFTLIQFFVFDKILKSVNNFKLNY